MLSPTNDPAVVPKLLLVVLNHETISQNRTGTLSKATKLMRERRADGRGMCIARAACGRARLGGDCCELPV